jgi:tyrosyl-tRNA synthetase
MLSFDSVKLRLEREQSLSYMEFNYMIIQAFDFLKLFEKKNCVLQIGGSDQWGNIVNGVDLIRRSYKKETFGLTTPLITLASGTKMGKTEKGAIWLSKKKFSPYDYWQFWRNTDDNDVVRFLKFFTEIEPVKIDDLAAKEKNINNLKRILANEATKILHGRKAAHDAEKTASDTFNFKGVGKDLPELQIDKFEIENGINILELLNKTNIMASKGEARRAIKNNGIKINEQLISDEKSIIDLSYFSSNNYIKVSFGKKKHFIIKFI